MASTYDCEFGWTRRWCLVDRIVELGSSPPSRSLFPPVSVNLTGFCRSSWLSSAGSSGRQDFGVKVFEQGKQQAKQVVAETLVRAPVEQVWRVLTDYEALPSFIPNLERCERLANAPPGRIRLRQLGCSQGALWRLEAEAVLEVEEVAGPLGRREARFTMVEGDFKQLSGRWIVEPDPSSAAGMSSILRYEVSLQPDLPLPNSIVSYVVRAGLPANIKAVAQRAEAVATSRLGASGLASWAGVEEDPPLPFDSAAAEAEQQAAATRSNVVAQTRNGPRAMADGNERLPTKGPFWPAGSPFAAAAPLTGEQQRRRAAAAAARSVYLGTTWVPLPPAGQRDPGVKELLDEQLKEKQRLQNLYPAFGLKRAGDGGRASSPRNSIEGSNGTAALRADAPSRGLQSLPAEVHLRRLDGLDFLHRRAVAAITVDAPASAVWEVLTDYDGLADFIPNLAASERIRLPASAPNNVVRVRQVGYKRMPFLCFHAESVLDLIEKPQR